MYNSKYAVLLWIGHRGSSVLRGRSNPYHSYFSQLEKGYRRGLITTETVVGSNPRAGDPWNPRPWSSPFGWQGLHMAHDSPWQLLKFTCYNHKCYFLLCFMAFIATPHCSWFHMAKSKGHHWFGPKLLPSPILPSRTTHSKVLLCEISALPLHGSHCFFTPIAHNVVSYLTLNWYKCERTLPTPRIESEHDSQCV